MEIEEKNCRDTIFVNPVLNDQALAQDVPHNEVCRVWAEELGSSWLTRFVACS